MGLFNSGLSALYREVVMDHARQPRNQRPLAEYTQQMELLNPTCGDAVVVQCLVKDDQIKDIAFTGYGCSISIASASMMTEALKGLSVTEGLRLIAYFNQVIGGLAQSDLEVDQAGMEEALKDALLLEGIKQFPGRYKCAALAWKAAEAAFQDSIVRGIEDE